MGYRGVSLAIDDLDWFDVKFVKRVSYYKRKKNDPVHAQAHAQVKVYENANRWAPKLTNQFTANPKPT